MNTKGGNSERWTIASLKEYFEGQFTTITIRNNDLRAADNKRIDDLVTSIKNRFDDLRIADERVRVADGQLRTADELRYQQLREKEQTAISAALLAAKEAVQTALLAAKEAVVKAEVATERRLEGLNELRQGVATKDQLDSITIRLDEVKERIGRIESIQIGRSGGLKDYMGYILFFIAIAGFIITALVRK